MSNYEIDIIFDVDGTLVNSFNIDSALYIEAVKEVLGNVIIDETWFVYKNITDSGILLEIANDNELDFESICEIVKSKFIHKISQCTSSDIKPIEGGVQFFNKLKTHHGKVGIATGGWGETAFIKLQKAGYDLSDVNIASSNQSVKRVEIMKICKALMGSNFNKTVYFGDAPWDLRACQDLGWNFIGVGNRLVGLHKDIVENFNDAHVYDLLSNF